jgi:hydroxymethylpyrimidine pyrophosphatase-like HAD family hydrolase
MVPKLICIDFDGTICDFKFPEIGDPKPGVKEALQSFRDMGYRIVIYTCRTCRFLPEIFHPDEIDIPQNARTVMLRKGVRDMKDWLDQHEIPYDEIDDGMLGKPLANAYIDDKGIRFDNNWKEIQEWVERCQP